MSTYILTSMFPRGFDVEVAQCMQKLITKRDKLFPKLVWWTEE